MSWRSKFGLSHWLCTWGLPRCSATSLPVIIIITRIAVSRAHTGPLMSINVTTKQMPGNTAPHVRNILQGLSWSPLSTTLTIPYDSIPNVTLSGLPPKSNGFFPGHVFTKFCENCLSSFCVILLTDKQTNICRKHKLLGGKDRKVKVKSTMLHKRA